MLMMRLRRGCSIAVAVFACSCTGAAATPAASPGRPVPQPATVQELMDTRIDPAADALWDAVAFIVSEKGEEDRRPRTPAEWAAVRKNARALIRAAAELGTPGRRVSAVDTSPGPGELHASDIQHRIDADPAAFRKRARALQAAVQKALATIDAKDADALMNAGGVIDAACEACHVVYWYPQQLQDHQ
jgi:cytochrome c556